MRAKQRSVHNTFFTLPVLFVMISNHYAMTYGHEWNWLILVAITLAGGLIRIYFVQRHFAARDTAETGNKVTASPIPSAIAFVILGFVSFVLTAPAKPDASNAVAPSTVIAGSDSGDMMDQVMPVIKQRCSVCHSVSPTVAGFASAPAGFLMDTPEQVIAQALKIHQQAVVTKVMPIGNMTKMTADERALIDTWFKSLGK
jgi:uncharacterized membrane protein